MKLAISLLYKRPPSNDARTDAPVGPAFDEIAFELHAALGGPDQYVCAPNDGFFNCCLGMSLESLHETLVVQKTEIASESEKIVPGEYAAARDQVDAFLH